MIKLVYTWSYFYLEKVEKLFRENNNIISGIT